MECIQPATLCTRDGLTLTPTLTLTLTPTLAPALALTLTLTLTGPGKGFGVFALREFEAGDKVMVEASSLRAPRDSPVALAVYY